MSVEHVDADLYKMNFRQDYQLDKALNAGIDTAEKLVDFISEEMYFGIPLDIDVHRYGCSAFATQTSDGK